MRIDKKNGLLEGAVQHESPNQDQRPEGVEPELIVVHCISLPPGHYGGPGIRQLFCNRLASDEHPYYAEIAGLLVSAHVVIMRDGTIHQFVPFHRRAWHAGESAYCGRSACNDFSIGIELEGVEDGEFEAIQYHQLAAIVAALCKAYPTLSFERMIGHSDIAPGRKFDPGSGFDWQRLLNLLKEEKRDHAE